MFYLVKTPYLLRKIYNKYLWRIDTAKKEVYLSFDDGPHPEATTFVLDELRKYNAPATFFCIGNNVELYPEVYKRIIDEGHAVGNHTFSHPNGWKTDNEIYLNDIAKAAGVIESKLFRPPYGKITSFQAKHLKNAMKNDDAKVVMWDVISGDFDGLVNPEKCLKNVIFNIRKGSIVVFHDSEKAFSKLKFALPRVLEFCKKEGYIFKKIS